MTIKLKTDIIEEILEAKEKYKEETGRDFELIINTEK